MLSPGVGVLLNALEFVDHGQDQAAFVGFEHVSEGVFGVCAPHGNVLLLHFAEQAFNPFLELAFEFSAIYDDHHGWRVEPILVFQNQACGGEQGKGFAGSLGVPYQPATPGWFGAAFDDAVDCAALMLAQYSLSRLAVFDIEKYPVSQGA